MNKNENYYAYLTVEEVSKLLGVTKDAVIKRIKRGSLKAKKFGKKLWAIPSDDVKEIIKKKEKE